MTSLSDATPKWSTLLPWPKHGHPRLWFPTLCPRHSDPVVWRHQRAPARTSRADFGCIPKSRASSQQNWDVKPTRIGYRFSPCFNVLYYMNMWSIMLWQFFIMGPFFTTPLDASWGSKNGYPISDPNPTRNIVRCDVHSWRICLTMFGTLTLKAHGLRPHLPMFPRISPYFPLKMVIFP